MFRSIRIIEEDGINSVLLLADAIAQVAWLEAQYGYVREQCAKAGRFLTKKEFLERPAYTIALTPLGMLAVLKAQIPFVNVVVAPQQPPQVRVHPALRNGKGLSPARG
jgi:hypothetical protein